jgi:hypothetical protein
MIEWLFVGLGGVFVGRHGAEVHKYRDAGERRRHIQVQGLAQFSGECLRDLVRLRSWQTSGGLEHQQVVIDPVLTEIDRPVVGRIWRRDEPAYEGIWCELLLPLAWREGPVDGVRAVQILRAVLQALDAIGERFGLGPLPVGKPPKTPAEAEDPFRAPDPRRRQAMDSASTWLVDKLDLIEPGQVLVAARGAGSGRLESRRARFIGTLGELVEHEERVLEDGKKVAMWTLRANW